MDAILQMYDRAWNTSDGAERRRLLDEALTEDCDLVEPRGRYAGRAAIVERINGFTDRFPGAKVEITSKLDEHNGFGRYSWEIHDREGTEVLRGIDVVERTEDGRLRRIVMFFGDLEPG